MMLLAFSVGLVLGIYIPLMSNDISKLLECLK